MSGKLREAVKLPDDKPLLVCHAPYTFSRLNLSAPGHLDILELFAFVRPAVFCVPTVGGLCRALGLPMPQSAEDAATSMFTIVDELILHLKELPEKQKLTDLASAMGASGQGWPWTSIVVEALGGIYNPASVTRSREALDVWTSLPEWADEAPMPPPANNVITGEGARAHLHDLITRRRAAGRGGDGRTAQDNYTTRIVPAFEPRLNENEPQVVTAEAGTGVGKTLGYLAPAQLWAEENQGAVWISTYTRNLQRQLDTELATLYPDDAERARKAVIRKGRENYLCLLNLSELAGQAGMARDPRTVVAAGLMARWTSATKDGDLSGNDFPGWLANLLGHENTTGLSDRRGECIYAACDHYHRCFIERAQRKARRARVIIGNHALAMINLTMSETGELPTRYVFDEGHHLFDAADSTFAANLSGLETADLRRWILGPEDEEASRIRQSRRSKGLRKRLEGLIPEDASAMKDLEDILQAARSLPAPGWQKRIKDNAPRGPMEIWLKAVESQVRARSNDPISPWSIECDVQPIDPSVLKNASSAAGVLLDIRTPMMMLSKYLRSRLEDEYDDLGADLRGRLDSLSRGLERRGDITLASWISMLGHLSSPVIPAPSSSVIPAPERGSSDRASARSHEPEQADGLDSRLRGNDDNGNGFVDWFEISRIDGRDIDVGFLRHHLDPTAPFATALKPHAHGVLMTSATLKDTRNDNEETWIESDRRTGAGKLSSFTPQRVSITSPFDYKNQTRVLVVRDVPKTDLKLTAKAYEALFRASGGGALGLFTAINRLRAVHSHLAPALESAGIPLYAQHVDDMDIGTLIDIFREEEDSCLLGTDAVRDGVDVPGRSLRLIVFDRVPWPRPTILHRERRKAHGGPGGGKLYDESITRMKLRQAYGRLVRATNDRGIFVLMDGAFPSRLEDSFPDGVPVERIGMDEALEICRSFYKK